MKILLVSGIYKPEIGGPAYYIPNLAQKLIELGHSVTVLTLKQSAAKIQSESWPVIYINRDQALIIRFIKTFLLIFKSARESDFIFANGLYQECGLALRLIKRKSIAKVVGDPVYERESNRGKTLLTRTEFNVKNLNARQRIQRVFLRFSLNSFVYITCPSKELVGLVQNWGVNKPIHLIANGVEQIEESSMEKIFDLVTVSRLLALKNIDNLIKATAITKTKLAIVGIGPEEIPLRRLAKKSGANVEFLGLVDNYKVIQILQKSKVFVLLSDYEGLSFALLQAMSAGLPSIVSNVTGNTDVIENLSDGVIVDPNNIIDITRAIEKIISDEKLRLILGKNAKTKVNKFYSQDKNMKEIFKLMNLDHIHE
jgi:glycosyltransferase involved in cell wall biosynthesis